MPATAIHPEQSPHRATWHWGNPDDAVSVDCPSVSDALGAVLGEIERATAYVGEDYSVPILIAILTNSRDFIFHWAIEACHPFEPATGFAKVTSEDPRINVATIQTD